MTEPMLDSCPLCGCSPDYADWFDEQQQFLVDCPYCTTYTITQGLANRFRCLLAPEERRMVERLSHYLRDAGDDDDREVTEDSWLRLAAEGGLVLFAGVWYRARMLMGSSCCRARLTTTAKSRKIRGCAWPPRGDLYFFTDFGTVRA